ncbi:MAG: VWA domain-containing protein [Fluviicoccus sp.]|uniref:vWA domain-containing protein n=1 Tax=Fluviicoccus sp. TaxID=2003552 RepID=UPI002718B343|nr:VWA domain-containing protein [Fluviicoccus sp.]MDO8329630.1 VWA domain-containing protein [Fluviicoccus sp.]
MNTVNETQRARRWRLILGNTGNADKLSPEDAGMDAALAALYGDGEEERNLDARGASRRGGLGASTPKVTRWLGDIRQYFPSPVVQLLQKDAYERLNLQQMLMEPEMLQAVEADVHLVGTLISLNRLMPARTRETARLVVRKVVDDLEQRLAQKMQQAITGSLNRASRTRRPRRVSDVDWGRTIRANLQHYQAEHRTIVPQNLIGYGRHRQSLKDIILCIDQSGSMASSVVYASIFGAVMASIRAVSTQLVVFDTSVVDLTPMLDDPVDVLFATQLGGGTDITQALSYCQGLVRRPEDTILVFISDLIEGGNSEAMLRRVASIIGSGVQMVTLLALSDEGAPCYDPRHAACFAELGSPAFACTPELFPELMAAVLNKQDVGEWAAQRGIVTRGGR